MKITIWNAARGGMRSVVEAYRQDGFLEQEGVTLIASYADGGVLKRQWVLAQGLATFAFYLVTQKVELVHCHAAMRGSFWRKGLFASLARLFGVPVVLHLHGSEMKLFYASQPGFAKALIRRHLEKAVRVIVLSQSWKDFVGSIAPGAHITVVPNYTVVPPATDPALKRPQDILFLGLVGNRKGVFDLIPAFAEVHARFPDARLIIGGNGEVEKAAELVRSLGLGDSVVLAGWVDGAAKAKLLETSSIYVLPSYNEGLPMSVLEAMAAGLAVVTTGVGGIPELITEGMDGLLVTPGDRPALARALESLLESAARRDQVAAAGRRRIEQQYSDKVILPRLHEIYRECSRPSGGLRNPSQVGAKD
ncbi:glycosyltransferase family 4 protein [Xanthobacter autotrophicus]|uniref:glycosyltransferase family 4 protein n=1 Tax=Xanthobacter autotrophicus TaxID=280 RepID=UPI003727B7E0